MEVSTRSLAFRYPVPDGFAISFRDVILPPASSTALLGPSGSGKTTFLNLLAGILPPAEGELHAGGFRLHTLGDAARRRYRQRNVGYLFQDFALVDYLNVLENVLLPLRMDGSTVPAPQERERARQLLRAVGLDGTERRAVTRLSKGEQQRVALCRALVMKPGLLLADEPTGNLDSALKFEAVALLREQAGRHGATLLVVTHDGEILEGFDRVMTMADLTGGGG